MLMHQFIESKLIGKKKVNKEQKLTILVPAKKINQKEDRNLIKYLKKV